MTRILHVTDSYLPRLGGIELHVRDLVRHQRRLGEDAQVLTPTPTTTPDPAWVHRGGRLVDIGADVVHVHASVWSPYATRVVRRCATRGIPTVVTVHSLWAPYGVLPGLAVTLTGARHWTVAWTAVSHRAAADVAQVLGGRVAVHVLANAVDAGAWRLPNGVPDPVGAPGPVRILTVGRLTWTKRCLALPGIMRDLRDRLQASSSVRLEVVGDGPQRDALEARVRRAGVEELVELTGRLDRPMIASRLRRADVYLAPAELESFGIAALEARCAGLPVVAHRRSGVTEFVTDGVEGLLADDDAGLVRSLERLVVEDGLRERIAAHNRAVPARCDWASATREAELAYRRAAALARPRRPRRPVVSLTPRVTV